MDNKALIERMRKLPPVFRKCTAAVVSSTGYFYPRDNIRKIGELYYIPVFLYHAPKDQENSVNRVNSDG